MKSTEKEIVNHRKSAGKVRSSSVSSEDVTITSPDKTIRGVPRQDKVEFKARRILLGCCYVLFVGFLNGFLFNVVKHSAKPNFYAPSFVVWLRCLFRICIFPFYTLLRLGWERVRGGQKKPPKESLSVIIRDGQKIYGEELKANAKFCLDLTLCVLLMMGSQWLSFLPLFAAEKPGALASMSTISFPISHFLSALIFNTKVPAAKISASTVSLAGISVLSLLELSSNPRWQEALLILAGGFFTAALQVAFRTKFRGRGGLTSLYYYVSLAALWMAVLMWPIVMYLKWAGIEYWDVNHLPWNQLIVTSTIAMLVISIVNAAVVHLPPVFTSLQTLMVVPAAYWWEKYLTGREISSVECSGALMAAAGALCIILCDFDLKAATVTLIGISHSWVQRLMTFTGLGVQAKIIKIKRS